MDTRDTLQATSNRSGKNAIVARVETWRPTLETVLVFVLIIVSALLGLALLRGLTGGGTETPVRPVQARPPGRVPPPSPAAAPLPTAPVSIAGATLKGSPTAPLVLIEYSDFKCPYCGRFATDAMPAIETKYVTTGKIQIAFHNLPLSIHPDARPAAIAAVCAGQQGQFWALHDLFFQDQRQVNEAGIARHAEALRLDEKTFAACRVGGGAAAQVDADEASARALGVTGTPMFFIAARQKDGTVKLIERLKGAQPAPAFEAAIDKAILAAASSVR